MEDYVQDISGIKEWDPTELKEVFSMLIFGKSFSGKTHAMKSFLKKIQVWYRNITNYMCLVIVRL